MINSVNLDVSATITQNFIFGAFVVVVLCIVAGLYFFDKDKNNNFSLSHLVLDDNGKGSLPKVLQLLGGSTGTFVVIQEAITKTLTADTLAVYLGALGVSEAFSKWVTAKYTKEQE